MNGIIQMTTLLLLALLMGCGTSDAPPSEPTAFDTTTVEQTRTLPYEMDATSRRLFNEAMAYAREHDLARRPIGEVMQVMGEFFLRKPYVTGILDVPGEETLICRLDGFDCVTFVETTLAMARGIEHGDFSEEAFRHNVADMRYRGGEMGDYCSRIHYFSEWITDNEARGTVVDVTEAIGGRPLDKRINFMSQNRDRYPRLADDDEMFACIREMEEELAEVSFFYIPKRETRAAYDGLQAGDVIAIVTDIEGLDITHTGLAYDHGDGRIGLLHASTSGGVIVSPDLQDYLMNNRRQVGILVARPAPQT